MADATEWYVKSEEGLVYGPASMAKLIDWAKDGRIEPTSFLSADREHWSPAPLRGELEMKWIVETELGKLFGPFHHDVVSRLINDRRVPATARLFRLYDGEQETGALVVVEPSRAAPSPAANPFANKKKSIFAGMAPSKLSALEAAARRELAAMKQAGGPAKFNPFGGAKR